MSVNNVPATATNDNVTKGAEMPTQTNSATFSTTATQGANMQTENITPIATATRTIVERIQDANLELVNLAICEDNIEQQLYVALGKCHDICLYLNDSKNLTAKYEFDSYYEKLRLKNTAKLSLVSKVLNCTFENLTVSKRSAYKAVIQFAIDEGVKAGEFVQFVTVTHTGLQKARLEKYKKAVDNGSILGYQARLQQTQSYFTQQQIAKVPELVLEGVVPTNQVGEQFVLIAQRTADGNVVFNVSTAESKAVNAVLNILYSGNKEQIANAAKASLQTSFPPTGTSPVPPDSFAASSYSTDASSNESVEDLINRAESRIAAEESLA
jgi:hypothetical protein